jgi:glycosyltransferase involved in cell wall biosynthesis
MTELSVVLISKNQAWNMGRLIESVLRNTTCVASREVALVDSASTDATIETANQYPIGVLRLRPDQRLTPAAGRYTGYEHTAGDFVLFLDGDMELCPGWLEHALQVLRDRPDVAMVTGVVVDLPKSARSDGAPPLPSRGEVEVSEIRYAGGAAMYRRSAIEEVGTFNPHLYSDEEPDICIRLGHAGYRALRLHYPIVHHYTDPPGGLSTLVGRWRRNLYLGAGQNLRFHLGTDVFWPYYKERAYGILPGLGFLAGLFSLLLSISTGQGIWFGLWLLMLAMIILGDAIRKRSLYKTLSSLLERLFILDGTIRGFLLKPRGPESYPAAFDVIKPLST